MPPLQPSRGAVELAEISEAVEFVGTAGTFAPSDKAALGVGGVGRGQYALTSLLPDEFGPDHVLQGFKGMVIEFRIQAE